MVKKVSLPFDDLEDARRALNNAMRWQRVHRIALLKWDAEVAEAKALFDKLTSK